MRYAFLLGAAAAVRKERGLCAALLFRLRGLLSGIVVSQGRMSERRTCNRSICFSERLYSSFFRLPRHQLLMNARGVKEHHKMHLKQRTEAEVEERV